MQVADAMLGTIRTAGDFDPTPSSVEEQLEPRAPSTDRAAINSGDFAKVSPRSVRNSECVIEVLYSLTH